MTRKSLLGVLAAALTTLLVAGCGSATTATDAAPSATAPTTGAAVLSEHNAADVTFAQQMIPHHQQAVAMAKLATDRAGNNKVKQLAASIQSAQDPEITQMQGFLDAWGAPHAGALGDMGAMPGMDHTTTAMPGMMSDADLAGLDQARGTTFDRMFLQMMTAHHQGAIAMARIELADGTNQQAKALAQNIITAQQGEITEMGQLLNG